MGFIPHSYDTGAPHGWEYVEASGLGEVMEGMALTLANGKLVKATGTTKPKYIGMFRGAVEDGDIIPVLRASSDVIFETTAAVSVAGVKVGDSVTIHTDGLQVTATTADGVAEIVRKDGDETGASVFVRFA